MPIAVLEKWIEGGSFNPECMAEGDYSHSTAILIVLNPNAQGTALESASVGLVVHWCKAPVGKDSQSSQPYQVCSFLDGSRRAIL